MAARVRTASRLVFFISFIFSFVHQYATGSVQNQGEIFAWHQFVTKGYEDDNGNVSA